MPAHLRGYFYAFVMFAAAVLQTLCIATYFHYGFLAGMRARAALVGAAYRKARLILRRNTG